MIRSLVIENFKAFTAPIKVTKLDKKNLVICGENGSGKTSFFEALKMIFYHDVMIKRNVDDAIVGEERQQAIQQFINDYTSKKSKSIFKIKINRKDYDSFVVCDDAFFISYQDIKNSKEISKADFENLFFPQPSLEMLNTLWREASFIDDVNNKLKDEFYEEAQIFCKEGPELIYGIKNATNNLQEDLMIDRFFNESTIHIIKLVVLFTLIERTPSSNKKRILVLDDIITSLDAENRALIIRYIVNHFCDYQKIILTHNAGVFHILYELTRPDDKWEWKSLCVNGSSIPQLFDSNSFNPNRTLEELVKRYNDRGVDIRKLGNDVRKEFEHLLTEFLRIQYYGDYHDVNYKIEVLMNYRSNNLYLCRNNEKLKTTHHLLGEIRDILAKTGTRNNTLKRRLNAKFAEYDASNELAKLKPIINSLRLFQKLTLHPMSHHIESGATFNKKEIKVILAFLSQLNKVIKGAKGRNNFSIDN